MIANARQGRRVAWVGMVVLLAVTPLLAAACGDDEESADPTTTTTPVEPCAEVYLAGDGPAEGPEAIEDRGAPELEACDPADGEMLVVDEIEGTGAEVAPGATVTVHYAGAGASTGTEFDSTWSRGAPSTFPLDQVIAGWSEGMAGMKEGGRRTLVIPPDLGYGTGGPVPGDYLVFTVDVVSASASEESTVSTIPASESGG
ncbi:MAG: FKBP-type peptidyl-prolyl cis-trans isomerase [Microthrixaceae bacterium]